MTDTQAEELRQEVGATVKRLFPTERYAFVLVLTNGREVEIVSNVSDIRQVPDILEDASNITHGKPRIVRGN